jgi:hypothetical protein
MIGAGSSDPARFERVSPVLHVDLHCHDFMDRVPVAQVALHVTLAVTPYFWHPAGESDDPGHPPPPHDHGENEPAFDLAEVFTTDVVSDAAGNASYDFHPAAVWARVAQVRLNGELPRNVIGLLSVNADVPWMQLHRATRDLMLRTPDASASVTIVVDPGKIIVGYTTPTSTRLWFQLHGTPASGLQMVAELTAGSDPPRRQVLAFTSGVLQTAVAPISGLRPATAYAIQLIAENGSDGSRVTIARGLVRTPPATRTRWDIAFTSCHEPSNLPSLMTWVRQAARPSADMMLMVGDQIYADGMAKGDTDYDGWLERYVRRYNQLWVYQPLRDVLRRTPTCMILDDHEVKDDWGVTSIEAIGRDRWRAALHAYQRFQDPLNPPGHSVPTVWDYGWRSGPIAVYMLDERSHRGQDDASNVLGAAQLARFQAWAASADTRMADVVLIGSGVPFAFLPIQRLLDTLNVGAEATGAVAGALVGSFGGPAGAIIGAMIGAAGAGIGMDTYVESRREPDFHDQWTYGSNQPELAKVLDILFDLANDITNSTPGPRPRAVMVFSGDVHIGGCYLLRSQRRDHGHDHRRNALIFQFISSPSSTAVPDSDVLRDLMAPVGHDVDLRRARFLSDDPEVDSDNPLDVSHFLLDTTGAHHYAAEMLGSLWEYNFGSMTIERSGPGRVYRFSVSVEGSTNSLTTLFELDLDAAVVRPNDLIGERLSATGTPVLLRVHERGSGYGPPSDRLDVEVIVQIDREPGRSFGFSLRDDVTQPAHRGMFGRLRHAFNTNVPVTIEYDRTGPRNGTIVRVY